MSWQFTRFGLLLAVAAVVSLTVASVGWRHRAEPGGLAFTVLLAGAATWAFGSALQVSSTTLEAKLLWRTVGYAGHNVVPVAFLVFALAYTGHHRWVTRRTVELLALEPAAVAFVVTPTSALGLHGLLWRDVGLASADGMLVLSQSFGPWYWLNTAYNYTLVVLALFLIVRMVVAVRGLARMQGVALVAGSLPPFFANVAWVAGRTPVDFTPLVFTVTGVAFGFALFRYRLLDLTPIRRDTVLDAMRDGYIVLDAINRVVDLNATARRFADVERPLVGRPVAASFPALAELVERYDVGDELREEVEIDGPDGPRYFAVRMTPLTAAEREPSLVRGYGFGGRLVFLRDVTDRRSVEHRYRALIEGSSDMIGVLDADGTITYMSPSSERILGYAPADLVGEQALDYIHPDDREVVRDWFSLSVGSPNQEASVEYRFERADGTWLVLESRARNLLDDPIVSGVVVNSRDVTDRVERERTLEAQNKRLDKFTAVVSHDLRNPLNVVQGRLELAHETGDDKHLVAAERASRRMAKLIDDLLSLARQGQTVDDPSPVALREVVQYAWSNVDDRDATLCVADELRLVADRERLAELFENLFRNSVEHGSTGNRTESDDDVENDDARPGVTIRVGACEGGFYVEDDGPGISPTDREQVFEHGYSTSHKGTGFGLSIVEEIVHAHGWEVAVTESADGGARFEVSNVEYPPPDA